MSKIFIALSTFAKEGKEPLEVLEKSGHEFFINPLKRRLVEKEIIDFAHDFEGIVAGVEPYTEKVLAKMPRLKCISRCGVGLDSIDLKAAEDKGIKICNTPDVVIQPVAELAVAMTFDLLRHLTWHAELMHKKLWKKKTGYLLQGKVFGVLGLGRIGKRVAEMFRALGIKVLGTDLNPDLFWAKENGVEVVSEDELLAQSDILGIHLSDKGQNSFCLNCARIEKMKSSAFVVNVARAKYIDEEALVKALRSNRLAGAALDVFEPEPYSGKLCDLDNVVLTPHLATLTKESRLRMETEAVENLFNALKK